MGLCRVPSPPLHPAPSHHVDSPRSVCFIGQPRTLQHCSHSPCTGVALCTRAAKACRCCPPPQPHAATVLIAQCATFASGAFEFLAYKLEVVNCLAAHPGGLPLGQLEQEARPPPGSGCKALGEVSRPTAKAPALFPPYPCARSSGRACQACPSGQLTYCPATLAYTAALDALPLPLQASTSLRRFLETYLSDCVALGPGANCWVQLHALPDGR